MAKRKKNLDEMTLEELRTEAAAAGVEGRSGMHKDELIAALRSGRTAAEGGDGHAETRSNTTSGGEETTPTDAGAKADGAEGIAVYPPSPSDQAGEKTDNVPPAKRLPPDVPPEEGGANQQKVLEAQLSAMATALRSLGIDPGPICDEAAKKVAPGSGTRAARGPTRTATVTPAGGSPVEVEYPADTPPERRDAAAVDAWKAQAGIWSVGTQPHVEHAEASETRGARGTKPGE